MILVLQKLFQKAEKNGTFANSFYERSITLISKRAVTIERKKIIDSP